MKFRSKMNQNRIKNNNSSKNNKKKLKPKKNLKINKINSNRLVGKKLITMICKFYMKIYTQLLESLKKT